MNLFKKLIGNNDSKFFSDLSKSQRLASMRDDVDKTVGNKNHDFKQLEKRRVASAKTR